jgi:hypothetical protein
VPKSGGEDDQKKANGKNLSSKGIGSVQRGTKATINNEGLTKESAIIVLRPAIMTAEIQDLEGPKAGGI